MKKSFLPTLFALALCLVLLPVSAFAADGIEYYSGAGSATATATSYTELTAESSVTSGIYYVNSTFAVDALAFTGDTTLVLGSGATLTVNGTLSCTGDLTVTTEKDATGAKLVVKGSDVTGGYSKSYGIYAESGSVNIYAGEVEATGGTASGNSLARSYGICAEKGMAVSGGTVTATGGAAKYSYGIFAQNGMTVSGGEVTANGGAATGGSINSYGIYANSSSGAGLSVSDTATVNATGGAANESYGISASSMTVSGGTVNATGGAAANYSYGIFASSMTVSGGKVTATGGTAGSYSSYGIKATGGVSIYAGEVKATGGAGKYSYGISASSMTISGGTLTVRSGESSNSRGYASDGSMTISGGTVKLPAGSTIGGTLKTEASGKTLLDYLADGTAYEKDSSLVDGSVKELSDVTVVTHTSHSYDSNGKCACGFTCDHTSVNSSTGKCSVCEKQFAAGVYGTTTSYNPTDPVYYATVEEAITALNAMSSEEYLAAFLNLHKDCTLSSEATITSTVGVTYLDLSGHTLTGDLTVATDKQCAMINGMLSGSVTVNSGNFNVYDGGKVSGDVTVNGGTLNVYKTGTGNGGEVTGAITVGQRGYLSVQNGGTVNTINANGGRTRVFGGTIGELTIDANASATLSGGTVTTKLRCDESHRLSEYLASGKAYYIANSTYKWDNGSNRYEWDTYEIGVKDAPITGASMSVDLTTVAFGETDASKRPTLTANATVTEGVSVSYQFRYSTDGSTDVSSWNPLGGSSASNTFTFPNDRAPGTYYVGCNVFIGNFMVYVKYATPITVEKGEQTVTTSPSGTNGLQYDGSAKQLIATAGVASGGTVYYQAVRDGEVEVNWTEYTDEVKVINAGDYTVNWYVKGDDNHKDIGSETEPQGSFTVTIAKADLPAADYPTDLTGFKGNALSSVTLPDGWTWVDGTQVMSAAGEQTFAANYAGTDNYNAKSGVQLTVDVSDKNPQTITATDITATYGDAGKKITATANGNGTISYAVKSGSENILSVDADTGVLSFKKAGTAVVTVSVSETATYAANSRDVTVTVNKAALTVTAKSQSIYVNETLPDLTNPVNDTHYTVTGLVSGDTLSVAMEYRKDGAAVTPNVTKAGSYEIAITATADAEKYEVTNNPGTLTINNKPSSGGGGSSSNTTSTTTKNPDGSTTTTVTDKKTGTVTETTKTATGTTSTTVTDKNGNSTTTVSVSKKDAQSGNTVTLPVDEVTAGKSEDAQEITVNVPSGGATVEIPVKNPTAGTVIVIVDKNGNETVVPTTKQTENGVTVTLTEDATIKVIRNGKTFADVKESDYFYDAVLWASARNITGGIGNDLFGPHDSCTRAQLVTFLWRAVGCPEPNATSSFSDVSAEAYYAKAVAWAFENGIVGGYGNGQFGSDDTITREQMAVILYRFAQHTGMDTTQSGMSVREYKDYESVSDYAVTAIQWAVNAGIMQGYDGNLMPGQPCTRAQIVTMLYRLLGE